MLVDQPLFATLWTVARQVPLAMELSRQEYWSGLPFPPPGYLPDPEIEPRSPSPQAGFLPSEPPGVLTSPPSYSKSDIAEARSPEISYGDNVSLPTTVTSLQGGQQGWQNHLQTPD